MSGKIAVNEHGVKELKNLANCLRRSRELITNRLDSLQSVFDESKNGLGYHSEKIGNILEEVRRVQQACLAPVDVLAENILELADAYQDLIDYDVYGNENGSSGSSTTSVVSVECRNSALAGEVHPETGIKFAPDTINHNGVSYSGVFPVLDAVDTVQLPEELYLSSDHEQKKHCASELERKIEIDDQLKSVFSDEQLVQIHISKVPAGYVWHHHQQPGKMELVDSAVHQQTGHTAGKSIWGGER